MSRLSQDNSMKKPTIAVLGSHSALDVCRGARSLGFKTLVIAEKGREQTYARHYMVNNGLGCVDECLVLPKFRDILDPDFQKKLIKKNVIFVPNRSFEVYLNSDYEAIEKEWRVATFGNKYLLKMEERTIHPNQYDLLQTANIRIPKQFTRPQDIDRLSLVKVSEKTRKFERAFFLVSSFSEFKIKSAQMIESGSITADALEEAVIEEFILGAQVNFNFFYSPLRDRLELLGTDTRRQTNLDGFLHLPAHAQLEALKVLPISYEEAGHMAVTVLESLLEGAFAIAERFVAATQKVSPPGIIGPFSLQSMITPGPPKKDIIVFDVSPRMPGSPGISATPYSGYLYGESISVGKRVAMEIQSAYKKRTIKKIIS